MPELAQESIRLFTFPNSPFGAKVYWALQFKGVEFDITYVNPFTKKELRFTKQGVVPVLTIGEEWVQDSRENCLRLEKLFPNCPFAGATDEERAAIVEADKWVDENITALHFLSVIDKNEGAATKRNAWRMANVILPTVKSIPSWVKKLLIPIWPILMRSAGFLVRMANALDTSKEISTLHGEVLREFEERIQKTGFIAGTAEPSFADIAAFAEIALLTTYGFENTLTATSSPAVGDWYHRIKGYLPDEPTPSLFQQWPPSGF